MIVTENADTHIYSRLGRLFEHVCLLYLNVITIEHVVSYILKLFKLLQCQINSMMQIRHYSSSFLS